MLLIRFSYAWSLFLSFGHGLEQFHLVLWFVITVAGGPMVLFPVIVMQCIHFHIYVTALVDIYMGILGVHHLSAENEFWTLKAEV